MRVDSLNELKAAFAGWRRGKRHPREAVPAELLERARRATEEHGVKEVVRAIRLERARLFRRPRRSMGEGPRAVASAEAARPALPAFSRLELSAEPLGARPIAELETPSGMKLRVFAETHAMVDLLSSLCGVGGAG